MEVSTDYFNTVQTPNVQQDLKSNAHNCAQGNRNTPLKRLFPHPVCHLLAWGTMDILRSTGLGALEDLSNISIHGNDIGHLPKLQKGQVHKCFDRCNVNTQLLSTSRWVAQNIWGLVGSTTTTLTRLLCSNKLRTSLPIRW